MFVNPFCKICGKSRSFKAKINHAECSKQLQSLDKQIKHKKNYAKYGEKNITYLTKFIEAKEK